MSIVAGDASSILKRVPHMTDAQLSGVVLGVATGHVVASERDSSTAVLHAVSDEMYHRARRREADSPAEHEACVARCSVCGRALR